MWVDGTPFDYFNWEKDNPDFKDDKEFCIQMDG